MYDNAKIHKAGIITNFLTNYGIDLLGPWPPYSPDLNPIEHLWARLRDELLKYCDDYGNILGEGTLEERIQSALDKAWNDLDEDYIKSCTSSFLRRLDAVIEAKGWYTKY